MNNKIIIIFFILFSIASGFAQDARKVAFISFSSDNAGTDNWIADGLEFLFNNKLSVISGLYSYDKALIQKALKEIGHDTGPLTSRSAGQLGRILDAEITISGTYSVTNSRLLFTVYYHNATSGDQVFREQIRTEENQLGNVADRIINSIAALANIRITDNEKELMRQSLTQNPLAFESFIKAYQENKKPDSNIEQVINLFKQAIKQDNNFWEAYYDLGIVYFNNEDYQSAQKQFNTIIKAVPNFDKSYYGRALIFEKQQKYDSALVDFKQVTEINPNDYKSFYYLGKINTILKDYDSAYENLNKAEQINPYYAPVFYAYGNLEVAQGNEKDAIPYYRKSLEIQPNNIQYRQTLGETYYRARVYYNALIEFENILETNPDNALANFMKGVTIYKQAVLEDLVDAFLEMLEEEDNREWIKEVRSKKVQSADPQKRFKALQNMALSFYNASINQADFLQATFNLALTYMEMDSLDKAEKYLNETLRIDPEFATAYIKMAEVFRRKNEISKAIEQFKKAFYIDPAYFVKKPTLGAEYQYRDIFREFMNELQENITRDRDNVENNIFLARVYQAQGYNGKALSIITKVLEDNPENLQAQNLKADLESN